MSEKKPRPPLTEAQLENLRKGRELGRAKAQENSIISRKQTSEIRKYKKEEEKANREAEYQKIIDARKARASKPVEEPITEPPPEPKKSHHSQGFQPMVLRQPKDTTKGQKPTPAPPPVPPAPPAPPPVPPALLAPEESSSEEEEEIPVPVPKKPSKSKILQSPIQDMYSKANIEMLRHRLYQQTRQRLKNDMFSY